MNSHLEALEFPAGTLLGEARRWFESLFARKYQPSTVRLSHKSLEMFSRFVMNHCGRRAARDVTQADLAEYHAELERRDLARATQENYLQTAKSYFDWLEKNGAIFENPANGLNIPRGRRPLQRVPTEKEVARVIDSIPRRTPYDDLDRACLEVAYGAGLRLNELLMLTVDSIDPVGCTVRVLGKGAKERVVPITRLAARAVRTYLTRGRKRLLPRAANEARLWISRYGRPLSQSGLRNRITYRAHCADLDLCPHDLRRAFATHLLRRGVSPAILKELLGHATYTHLNEYLRYVPKDLMEIHKRTHPAK